MKTTSTHTVIFCGTRPPEGLRGYEELLWQNARSKDVEAAWNLWESRVGKIWIAVEGEARGVDRLVRAEALGRGVPFLGWPADWEKHGKAAGRVRNREMADFPLVTGCVAVWDGSSRGTADMIEVALSKGLPTLIWRYNREGDDKAEFRNIEVPEVRAGD